MRIIHLILLSALLVAPSAGGADCARQLEFDRIAAVVTHDFYDRKFRGLDWPARVASYRREVDCSASEQVLSTLLNRLLAELQASHTNLFTANDFEYWALQSIYSGRMDTYRVAFSGIWPQRRAGRWFAKYVLPGSPAHVAGVLAGDELLSLNGGAFDPLGMRREVDATLVVSSDGSKQRTVVMTPALRSLQEFLFDATAHSEAVLNVQGKRVGYLHLWSGTHAAFLNYMNATLAGFARQQLDALIIDYRGGFGGAGVEYLHSLQLGQLRHIPQYFLIDDGVRSGKELLADAVRRRHLGTLVGSTTAGAFLFGRGYRLFDERYFLLLAVSDPGVKPAIEGAGVAPDVAVAPCREYCAGADPQLEKALALIGQTR